MMGVGGCGVGVASPKDKCPGIAVAKGANPLCEPPPRDKEASKHTGWDRRALWGREWGAGRVSLGGRGLAAVSDGRWHVGGEPTFTTEGSNSECGRCRASGWCHAPGRR